MCPNKTFPACQLNSETLRSVYDVALSVAGTQVISIVTLRNTKVLLFVIHLLIMSLIFSTIQIKYSLTILITLIPNPRYGIRKMFLMGHNDVGHMK